MLTIRNWLMSGSTAARNESNSTRGRRLGGILGGGLLVSPGDEMMILNLFAIIGAIATVARLVLREIRFIAKSRKWKPTPWLGLPWGL